jgi:hypothetical protein
MQLLFFSSLSPISLQRVYHSSLGPFVSSEAVDVFPVLFIYTRTCKLYRILFDHHPSRSLSPSCIFFYLPPSLTLTHSNRHPISLSVSTQFLGHPSQLPAPLSHRKRPQPSPLQTQQYFLGEKCMCAYHKPHRQNQEHLLTHTRTIRVCTCLCVYCMCVCPCHCYMGNWRMRDTQAFCSLGPCYLDCL